MRFLVKNCFQWVGFHIVNNLLDTGHEVVGLDHLVDAKKEFLYGFVGRNANFICCETPPKKHEHFDGVISVHLEGLETKTNTILFIEQYNEQGLLVNQSKIIVSLLVGEWMPLTRKGVYMQENVMKYTSPYWEKVLYMTDFLETLSQILISTVKRPIILVNSQEKHDKTSDFFENHLSIRKTRSATDIIYRLKKHYSRYLNFYRLY